MNAQALSERLATVLGEYYDVELRGLREDLAERVQSGPLAWLPGEFEAALRAHAITPEVWGDITSSGIEDDEDWVFVDNELREIWTQVASGRPYPYDEPDTDPPPGWTDHTNRDGISERLASTLTRYLRDARDDARTEPGNLHVDLFRNMVAHGGWSWLPPAYEDALRSGNLTDEVWGRLVYGDPNPDPTAANTDKHRLWQAVAPGHPYPST